MPRHKVNGIIRTTVSVRNYEKVLCEAILDRYDSLNNIGAFIFNAIDNTEVVGRGSKARFKYIKDDKK